MEASIPILSVLCAIMCMIGYKVWTGLMDVQASSATAGELTVIDERRNESVSNILSFAILFIYLLSFYRLKRIFISPFNVLNALKLSCSFY